MGIEVTAECLVLPANVAHASTQLVYAEFGIHEDASGEYREEVAEVDSERFLVVLEFGGFLLCIFEAPGKLDVEGREVPPFPPFRLEGRGLFVFDTFPNLPVHELQ